MTQKTVAVCDTEPVVVEGMKAILAEGQDFRLAGAETSLISAMEMVRRGTPDVVLIDKAFGIHAVIDWLETIRVAQRLTRAVVWGTTMSESEAMRFMRAGAGGVIRKTAALDALCNCLRVVAGGKPWMEDSLFGEPERSFGATRANLTAREVQVLELVERGFKNKDIGLALGIKAGTVKIHLKHIFEKTGIRGRYGLALSCLKEKGLISLQATV